MNIAILKNADQWNKTMDAVLQVMAESLTTEDISYQGLLDMTVEGYEDALKGNNPCEVYLDDAHAAGYMYGFLKAMKKHQMVKGVEGNCHVYNHKE